MLHASLLRLRLVRRGRPGLIVHDHCAELWSLTAAGDQTGCGPAGECHAKRSRESGIGHSATAVAAQYESYGSLSSELATRQADGAGHGQASQAQRPQTRQCPRPPLWLETVANRGFV